MHRLLYNTLRVLLMQSYSQAHCPALIPVHAIHPAGARLADTAPALAVRVRLGGSARGARKQRPALRGCAVAVLGVAVTSSAERTVAECPAGAVEVGALRHRRRRAVHPRLDHDGQVEYQCAAGPEEVWQRPEEIVCCLPLADRDEDNAEHIQHVAQECKEE